MKNLESQQKYCIFARPKHKIPMNIFSQLISERTNLPEHSVSATIALLDEGCTIPFISRYRKERTGNLNEIQITLISEQYERLKEIQKRKETILKSIREQEKLTSELEERINKCWDQTELEDIYLPFKPKRHTRAEVAKQKGLEPLATLIMLQREQSPDRAAARFVKGDVKDVDDALNGAKDIIAEQISEDEQARNTVRKDYRREAVITSKVIKKKADDDDAQKFLSYFDFSKPLKRVSSHQLLAMRRGEAAGVLRVTITANDEECIYKLKRQFVHGNGPCQKIVGEATEDAFKRLIDPSIENEFAGLSKEQADDEAINVFEENLRQLLLSPPLGQKRTMAVDPGYANGCKIACLDAQGNLLHHEIIFPHPPKRFYAQATISLMRMIHDYKIEAIAIGNGTASRETQDFVNDVINEYQRQYKADSKPSIFVVSEDGASIYSASPTAREEFPDEDVTTRGAVSIGRRLMDPLAELVKIDPKNLGIGQYQHDVDQKKLKHELDMTVESCVNQVGVDLNTASPHLLQYVSGLGPQLAKNIVEYRRENGAFTSRAQLRKVPRLGAVAYEQCAGFLRIPGARNPLDNSAVHPESYHVVEAMAKDNGCTVAELIKDKEKQKQIDIRKYVTKDVGIPTLTDIMQELDKPGRDPRGAMEEFHFDEHVHTIEDLQVGMELPGIVTNITNFGAFVDVGVHQDGLVHISQLADKFVSDPTKVVHLHQHVRVKVIDVDERRHRISLSMKGLKQD